MQLVGVPSCGLNVTSLLRYQSILPAYSIYGVTVKCTVHTNCCYMFVHISVCVIDSDGVHLCKKSLSYPLQFYANSVTVMYCIRLTVAVY